MKDFASIPALLEQLDHHQDIECPLLVIRFSELGAIAWRDGQSSARQREREYIAIAQEAALPMLRNDDCIVHEPGSGELLIALCSRARTGHAPLAVDARHILGRLNTVLKQHITTTFESGWSMLSCDADRPMLQSKITEALVRGAQERERYDFFSAIGHELRTPLTAIRGYLETLIDEDLSPMLQDKFMRIALAETLRMGRFIDGMFDISLLDLRTGQLHSESTSLYEALEHAFASAQHLMLQQHLHHEDTLKHDVVIPIQRDRLVQVLMNLLDNATKHAQSNVHIIVRTYLDQQRSLILSVEDDGIGVPLEDRERIFTLGERGQSDAPGTGIGLAVVRLFIERAGGCITCETSALGGSAFIIRLPLVQPAVASSARSALP